MFSVIGTDPANGAVVYAIERIRITLDDPIDISTIDSSVSLINSSYAAIPITRTLMAGTSNVIEIVPNAPLEYDDYQVIVSSNLLSQFGEMLSAENGGSFYASFTYANAGSSDGGGLPTPSLSTSLGVVTAIPESNAYGVKTGEAAVIFTEPVDLVKLVLSEGDNLDDVLTMSRRVSHTLDGSTLILNWENEPNKRYLFDLAVMGRDSQQILPVRLEYYSHLDPGYATVNQIRSDLGSAISSVSNQAIFLMISDCSLLAQMIAQAAGALKRPSSKLALREYTRYAVEYRLLREFVVDSFVTGANSKRLGDFEVSREVKANAKIVSILERLQSEILRWEDVLTGMAGLGPARIGIASKGSTHYAIDPKTNRIIVDEHGKPLTDPYIPSRVRLPNMWEPRFRRIYP